MFQIRAFPNMTVEENVQFALLPKINTGKRPLSYLLVKNSGKEDPVCLGARNNAWPYPIPCT
jgi:hypothetical protein